MTAIPGLTDLVVRPSVVLLLALGVAVVLRRRSAASRHVVWSAALCAALFVPFAGLMAPAALVLPHGLGGSALSDALPLALPTRTGLPWPLLWLVGAAMVAVTRIRRLVMLGRAGREAAVTDEPRLAAVLTASRRRLGVERPVRLLLGGPGDVPMTWGWWRPRILLPSGALAWPDRQVEFVLLHELAHVRRGDVVLHRVAELASVVLWFHPLTWYAMRRMTVEREYACDDAVVRCGVRPGEYAKELLALTQSVLAARALTAAAALTSRSQIRSRLLAILDDTKARSRRPGAAPSTVVAIGVLVALSISAVRPDPLAVPDGSARFRLTAAREQAASPYEFRFRYDLAFAFDFGRDAPARRTPPEEHPE